MSNKKRRSDKDYHCRRYLTILALNALMIAIILTENKDPVTTTSLVTLVIIVRTATIVRASANVIIISIQF